MEMKVIQEQKNPLFSRQEVKIAVYDALTPSKEESKNIIAKKYSADPALVRIRDIKSKFGSQEFVITADIYDSLEEFKRVVKKTKQEVALEKKAEDERKKAEEEARKAKEEAAMAAEAGEEAQSE